MEVGDVFFVAVNRLDVQLTLLILARVERQEVPPFPAGNEHAALYLRHVFLGHAFEPGPDVYRLIERALRLGAPVVVDQSAARTAGCTKSPTLRATLRFRSHRLIRAPRSLAVLTPWRRCRAT